jgi:acetyltransferase EpsM
MLGDLIIIGGGGHASVVVEAALSDRRGWRILGFVAPNAESELAGRLDVPYLGDDTTLQDYATASAVLGFGALPPSDARTLALNRLGAMVARWATIVHGSAWVSPTATLGEGTVVMAGAVVQTGARVGAHVIVNSGAVVEHDVSLADHVQVAPGAVIGGGTSVGSGVYIGLGASVRDHVEIGAGAIIGMGSCVVKNVSAGSIVMGDRAR